MTTNLPEHVLRILQSITNKRAKIVIDHIMEHGLITTEDLVTKYGYDHPPRAARDVREAGIPLETFSVRSANGRRIAAYRFGNFDNIRIARLHGRRMIPKALKQDLYTRFDGKCGICSVGLEERYFQVDHRVPYEVAGDPDTAFTNASQYLLLCGSCNRAKSWSCEHCPNWLEAKQDTVCSTCYWATPESYCHIALREIRRIDIVWSEDEILTYERLKDAAMAASQPLSEHVKRILALHFPEA